MLCEKEEELYSSHEEAGSQMFLQLCHISWDCNVVICTDETDCNVSIYLIRKLTFDARLEFRTKAPCVMSR